jgi:RHH-type transcriptional regulator, rel operon repressor / antitoxin RelB
MTLSRKGTREFRDLERWQIEEIEKAIAEADRGEFASDEEVEQVLKRLMGRRAHGRSLTQDAHRKV